VTYIYIETCGTKALDILRSKRSVNSGCSSA